MYLTSDKKKEFFTDYGKSVADTGSPEGQVAMFTYRINHLTNHLKRIRKISQPAGRSYLSLVKGAGSSST